MIPRTNVARFYYHMHMYVVDCTTQFVLHLCVFSERINILYNFVLFDNNEYDDSVKSIYERRVFSRKRLHALQRVKYSIEKRRKAWFSWCASQIWHKTVWRAYALWIANKQVFVIFLRARSMLTRKPPNTNHLILKLFTHKIFYTFTSESSAAYGQFGFVFCR